MLDNRIEFTERYNSEEDETVTLYFVAPKELFESVCDEETVFVTISLEFPDTQLEASSADVQISPTDNDGDCYNWTDYDLPYEEIDALMTLAKV